MSCAAMKLLMTAISSSNGDDLPERHETVDFTLIPRETTAQLQ
jgi:DNA-binding LacI/PurR family transcriptional regulator